MKTAMEIAKEVIAEMDVKPIQSTAYCQLPTAIVRPLAEAVVKLTEENEKFQKDIGRNWRQPMRNLERKLEQQSQALKEAYCLIDWLSKEVSPVQDAAKRWLSKHGTKP